MGLSREPYGCVRLHDSACLLISENILQKSQSRAVMMSVCKVADNLGNGQSYGVIVDEEEAEGGLVE